MLLIEMSGLRRMNAIRPEKTKFLAMQQAMKNNASSFSKNEMNAARKNYEAEEQGKHAKMWSQHDSSKFWGRPWGGKRKTKKHGKRRATKKRSHTRRQ